MPKTLGDLLSQRVLYDFVDREEELALFRGFIDLDSREAILLISGMGGVGKSFFLTKCAYIAEVEGMAVGFADLATANTPLEVLQEWRRNLPGAWFEKFDLTLAQYDKVVRHITTMAQSTATGASALGELPGEESIPSDLITELIEVLDYRLTREFAASIASGEQDYPFVLMLDDFELADHRLREWLRATLTNLLPTRTRLVVAGRQIHRESWPVWSNLVIQLELQPFTAEATAQYLRPRGIDDPEVVRAVHEFTLGLPLALALMANLDLATMEIRDLKSRGGQIAHEIVRRLLRTLEWDRDLYEAIEAAAVLDKFNADTLSEFCSRDMRNAFMHLREMSFVRRSEAGLSMHNVVREYILRILEADSPEYLRELRARARGTRLSPRERKLLKTLHTEQPVSASDISILSQTLQSEVDRTIQSLRDEELIDQVGTSEDGEPLFSLTETGALLLESTEVKLP